MCVIRGSLMIITSIPNEAGFSLESKTAIQRALKCACFCFFDYVVGQVSTASHSTRR